LRNTVAVCRKSYINPLVFTAWQTGILHQYREEAESVQEELENRILLFLRSASATGQQGWQGYGVKPDRGR
jgi:DNA topoisomerase IB